MTPADSGGNLAENPRGADSESEIATKPNLRDPHVVLSLLEADQVVAAKEQTRFGRRNLSWGVRVLLWGLRIYVIAMLVLVVVSLLRATHSMH
ncbi:MAG TPA: hypothetical protein VNV41_19170 [Candidatus Acidoferrales bacterium]|jgi:hypothetical protein|nr:hypothetical protein [Candidatus Acidoferrales bacterium]